MKRPRLQAVQARPGHRLNLTFINGQSFDLSLDEDIKRYPGLKPLSEPKAFAKATIGDAGWTVEWPELDIQIGADTLYLDALAQSASDENTRIFIGWRARHQMSLDQAARALGVATRSISRYSNGREAVPRYLALACLGWEGLHQSDRSPVAG